MRGSCAKVKSAQCCREAMGYRVSLQMPQRTVPVRNLAGVAASHCDVPGHGILD